MSLSNAATAVGSVPRPNFRIVIVMMSIALVLSTLFSLRREDDNQPIADFYSLPRNIGDWRFYEDAPLDPNLMDEMKADAYSDRIYVNVRTGQNVQVLLVYRRYGRREFAHRPDQCYPAAGYNITSKDHVTLPWAGRDVDAIHLVADGSHVQGPNGKVGYPDETLSYFFASGDRTESNFIVQQLLMAVERLIPNKNGWTFIRLSSQHRTDDTDALLAQQDFLRCYGPAIQAAITTDTSATSRTTAEALTPAAPPGVRP